MDKSIFKLLVAVSLSLHAEYIRDSDKQVVLDASSGLVWQDNTLDSTLHWTTAIKTCEALELGGYSDWRLPNYSELSQLADRSKSSTAVSSMFQNTLAVTIGLPLPTPLPRSRRGMSTSATAAAIPTISPIAVISAA